MTGLPPAGWYEDPTDSSSQRWWDGDQWTEHRRPALAAPEVRPSGDMRLLGDMMGHAFELLRARAGGIIGLSLVATVPIVAMFALVFVAVASVTFDFDSSGPSVDGGGIALFYLVLLFAVVGLLAAFLGVITLLWDAAIGRERSWVEALGNGFRRLFPFLGWMLLGIAPGIVVFLLLIAMVASTSDNTGGLLSLLIVVPWAYWSIVLYFVPVMVVRQSGANPIGEAWNIVKGRWWRIFGRLFVWGLLMGLLAIGVVLVGSLLARGLGDLGDGLVGLVIGIVFVGGYFLAYALQTAPVVSIAYDLVGTPAQPEFSDS